MLQHRYELDPGKRYVFLRVPRDSTFHCTIEVSTKPDEKGIIIASKEFPCRSVKNKDMMAFVLVGVENMGCLKYENLKQNYFRFRYRIEDESTDTRDCVFIPLNNYVKLSYTYGTEDDLAMGVGDKEVQLIYQFDKNRKDLVSSWILSPWFANWSLEGIKKTMSQLMDKTQILLPIELSI